MKDPLAFVGMIRGSFQIKSASERSHFFCPRYFSREIFFFRYARDAAIAYNGFISLVNFKNFVTVGVNLKKYDWVENFINKYTEKLPPDDRNNAFNYCMGILNFSRGDFEKALNFAGKTTYEDVYYKMEVKVLTLKIYYELGLFDEAFNLIESFRHFLSNNKLIPAYIRESNKNFIILLNQIIRLNSKNDSYGIHQLKNQILKAKYLMSRKWLTLKIEAIELTLE